MTEKPFEVIRTYTDSVRHKVNVGTALRCKECGAIFFNIKQAHAHHKEHKGKKK